MSGKTHVTFLSKLNLLHKLADVLLRENNATKNGDVAQLIFHKNQMLVVEQI